jgi:hypothetical protein
VAVDNASRIYVLKKVINAKKQSLLLSRYLPDGALDLSYRSNGHFLIEKILSDDFKTSSADLKICPVTGDVLISVLGSTTPEMPPGLNMHDVFRGQGSISLRGFLRRSRLTQYRFAIARFDSDGNVVLGFGKKGVKVFKFAEGISPVSNLLPRLSVARNGDLIIASVLAVSDRYEIFLKISFLDADGQGKKFEVIPTPDALVVIAGSFGLSENGALRGVGLISPLNLTDSMTDTNFTTPFYIDNDALVVTDYFKERVAGFAFSDAALFPENTEFPLVPALFGKNEKREETLEIIRLVGEKAMPLAKTTVRSLGTMSPADEALGGSNQLLHYVGFDGKIFYLGSNKTRDALAVVSVQHKNAILERSSPIILGATTVQRSTCIDQILR